MTLATPAAPALEPAGQAPALVLRSSRELQQLPRERLPAPAAAVPAPAPAPAPVVATSPRPAPALAAAAMGPLAARWPAADALSRRLIGGLPPESTWIFASATLAAGVGWLYERRRRLQLELLRDTASWPSVRQPLRAGARTQTLDEILTDRRDPEESARSIYPSAMGETTSRREATLIDLHEVRDLLQSLREQHDITSATEMLEQHIADFRYTSPWVFLELRELYKQLERPNEWSMAREAFRKRFGQNAPQWASASTAGDEIAGDEQLSRELLRKWPRREFRMFILRWMLGDSQTRQKNSGPPQLTLGIYRDMLLLDAILDDVMAARPTAAPVLADAA